MNALEPTHICPLCNQENHCMAEQIRRGLASSCWCFTAQIPSALLERIPADQKESCICSRCVENFRLEGSN